ncbi:hypothetical protein SCLCIDRAFT_34708 [Scleroderma citrinum Foug A]|uniref:Uncharacterized protein n=1 Tax=Scleroderma citrinum Foug A TaxID=1036808 RepID=A0A0C3D0Z1_9AGAM|nr:hypothetical protein SCLCIDRAFT_34708 [Scleroderma citrinum Foug A]
MSIEGSEWSREGPSSNSKTSSLYLKKHHSHCKTMDTDEEDSYSSFGEDSLGSDDSGPP